jgi:hypothetical protein
MLGDTKLVIGSRKLKKDGQHNDGQNKEDKWTKMIYKTLHRKQKLININPTKNRGELMCSGRVSSSCSTCGTRRKLPLLQLSMRNGLWYGKRSVVICDTDTQNTHYLI